MQTRANDVVLRAAALGVGAFVYFVIFPQDLDSFLNPVAKVLALSNAVSPWLYAVLGLAVVAWVVFRVWGR